MAISVNWPTKVISVPQSYLSLIEGVRYELDVDQFRLDLRSLEDDAEGITFLKTHRHNTEVVLGGVTYARFVEIINDYTVTFENGSYIVELVGANNNILEKTNYNQVSVREKNSAGLIVTSSGSGLSQDQSDKLDSIYSDSGTNTPKISTIYTNSETDTTKIGTIYTNSEGNTPKIDTIYTNSEADTTKIGTIYTNSETDTTKIDTIYTNSEADTTKIGTIYTNSEGDTTKIDEIHERFALNDQRPVTHSEDGIDSTNIDINITDNGDGTYTEERQ